MDSSGVGRATSDLEGGSQSREVQCLGGDAGKPDEGVDVIKEILEYVEVNEELPPDLSNAQLDELVGEEKMIVECHHAHIRNTYQLTDYGKSQLASKND